MIQGVAVESAAIELWDGADPDMPWERTSEYVKERTRARARKVLEAAAPHMLRHVYDLGFTHGSTEPKNPYKSKA